MAEHIPTLADGIAAEEQRQHAHAAEMWAQDRSFISRVGGSMVDLAGWAPTWLANKVTGGRVAVVDDAGDRLIALSNTKTGLDNMVGLGSANPDDYSYQKQLELAHAKTAREKEIIGPKGEAAAKFVGGGLATAPFGGIVVKTLGALGEVTGATALLSKAVTAAKGLLPAGKAAAGVVEKAAADGAAGAGEGATVAPRVVEPPVRTAGHAGEGRGPTPHSKPPATSDAEAAALKEKWGLPKEHDAPEPGTAPKPLGRRKITPEEAAQLAAAKTPNEYLVIAHNLEIPGDLAGPGLVEQFAKRGIWAWMKANPGQAFGLVAAGEAGLVGGSIALYRNMWTANSTVDATNAGNAQQERVSNAGAMTPEDFAEAARKRRAAPEPMH